MLFPDDSDCAILEALCAGAGQDFSKGRGRPIPVQRLDPGFCSVGAQHCSSLRVHGGKFVVYVWHKNLFLTTYTKAIEEGMGTAKCFIPIIIHSPTHWTFSGRILLAYHNTVLCFTNIRALTPPVMLE